jgi:hypothetical protein
MRNCCKLIAIVVLCVLSLSNLFGQALFKDVKVTPRWVTGPGIQAGNVIERGVKLQTRWLQIDVDFSSIIMKQPWLDGVVFQYDVLLPQTTSKKVVLSGKVQYWSIAMDGKTHHVQAFVHPRFLQRYAPGLKMRKSDLKDLRIFITILQNDSPIGMGAYKPTSKTSPKAVRSEIQKALSDRKTFKGKDSVFSRDDTPWGVINVDYYELIKRKK